MEKAKPNQYLPVYKRHMVKPYTDEKCAGTASDRGTAIAVTDVRPDRVLNTWIATINGEQAWVVAYFNPPNPPPLTRLETRRG